MSAKNKNVAVPDDEDLFGRVVSILEQAKSNVVRSVNSNMVLAYWLIGREIVLGVQEGEERAGYGRQVIKSLSSRLKNRYGRGFSVASLENFRKLYLTFEDRGPNSLPAGRELTSTALAAQKSYPGRELNDSTALIRAADSDNFKIFSAELTWSHYRAIMRVSDKKARDFYEREAIECGWSKAQLERQIHSSLYNRIVANQGSDGLLSSERERLPGKSVSPQEILRSPMVLEFLNLPDSATLHESDLEQAIINNLQSFLLEMGKGFSFVARQKHIRFDDEDFFVDLVFYNFILKCFVLVDLKMGKLSHGDVGQMDGYVRLYEDRFKVEGDNPTVGLILCSDKSEAVAQYSVLSEGRQIFASKYLQFLPSEEALRLEIERERNLLESRREEARGDVNG